MVLLVPLLLVPLLLVPFTDEVRKAEKVFLIRRHHIHSSIHVSSNYFFTCLLSHPSTQLIQNMVPTVPLGLSN